MKKHLFRHLILPGILMAFVTMATAQVIIQKPFGPGMKPGISKATTTTVTPSLVKPVVPPVQPLPPKTIYTTPPVVIVPSYPSAWVGPTIIRESRSQPAPSAFPPPAAVSSPTTATLRLVAVLGTLRHLDAATGADRGLAEARLGISVGMMVGYAGTRTVRASGDFFGVPWDGPGYFTRSDDSRAGEFLDHPIVSVNEFLPGPWEFEAGIAGHQVEWMRLAVALFEDESHDPNARQPNLPRGRRAAMREVLLRISWADKGVATRSAGIAGPDALAGGDVTYFGKSLATFGEKTMTPVPENQRIGIAEWYFATQDMGKVLESCPRFMDPPDGSQLRSARTAAGATPPPWALPFELRSDRDRYAGELWFVVVPDAAMNPWLQGK